VYYFDNGNPQDPIPDEIATALLSPDSYTAGTFQFNNPNELEQFYQNFLSLTNDDHVWMSHYNHD